MRFCWDDLEGIYLSKNNKFRKNNTTYVYKNQCTLCGEPYLTDKQHQSNFCSNLCAYRSDEFRAKLSAANIGKNNNMYGKTHSKATRKKISANVKGNNQAWTKTFTSRMC